MNNFDKPGKDPIREALEKDLKDHGYEFATENKNRLRTPEEIAALKAKADKQLELNSKKNINGTQLDIDFEEEK